MADLTALDEGVGLKFIVGSRQDKAPGDLANHFHWNGEAFTDGQLINTITPRHGNTRTTTNKRRRAPVWDPEQHPGHRRAVWAHSQKRATLDGHTLTAQETRARAVIDADAAARSTRFVKTTASGRTLDTASLERARRLVGLKGCVTNVPATAMAAAEVLSSYHHAAPDPVRAAPSRRPHPADPTPGPRERRHDHSADHQETRALSKCIKLTRRRIAPRALPGSAGGRGRRCCRRCAGARWRPRARR